MADDASRDERRFDPTPKRRREFRNKGRVALSRDVAGAVQLCAIIVAFLLIGDAFIGGIAATLVWVIEHAGDGGGLALDFGEVLAAHVQALIGPTLVLSAILIVATLIAYFAQTGLLFSGAALMPKLERLDPFKRLKELFSPKNFFVKSGLTLAKLGLAGFAIVLVLATQLPAITALGLSTLDGAHTTLGAVLESLLLTTVALLALVAAVDYLWQRHKLMAEMKMTREELKKETEEEEGKPEIKQRRRQRHRELSLNRIVQEVPRADVILTNPTHVAVALRYDAQRHRAPVVVAKGAEDLAALIRKIARDNGVPIIEQRSLARALYNTVKVGRPIPQSFFQAVAQVLARVYRARAETGHRP